MSKLKVCFHTFGNPAEVLALEEYDPAPALQCGEIRVQPLFSPINPADINYIQGIYGVKPQLPATPGLEGCGVVIESNAERVNVGDSVIFITNVGAWNHEVICSEDAVYVLPQELALDAQQFSMLKVNPLTALRLLEDFAELQPSDYVIQNAANSGVGQCLIQLAKLLGLKTINLVRREEAMPNLSRLGADHVFLDDSAAVEKVRKICGDNLPKLACNAVGGDSALRLMDAIASKSPHVTYGAMSLRSLKVPNKFLIFKRICLEGLWVTEWLAENDATKIHATYTKLAQWISEGKLYQDIDTIYPVKEIRKAIQHAMTSKRNGKILLQF